MCRVAKLEAGASGSPALPEASPLFIHVNRVPHSATTSVHPFPGDLELKNLLENQDGKRKGGRGGEGKGSVLFSRVPLGPDDGPKLRM